MIFATLYLTSSARNVLNRQKSVPSHLFPNCDYSVLSMRKNEPVKQIFHGNDWCDLCCHRPLTANISTTTLKKLAFTRINLYAYKPKKTIYASLLVVSNLVSNVA